MRGIKTRGPRSATCPHHATPTPLAPKTQHARNQVGTRSPDAAAPAGGQNMGRGSERRGSQAARPTVDAARRPAQDRPALSRAGHYPSHAGVAIVPLAPAVRRAPPRHRPGLRRSLSGDPLLDPAGSRSLHRRGRRAAPGPRRHARAGDPTGTGGQSRARPQGEGGGGSVSRPPAQDAAAGADEHGLRAAQLPEAPPRAPVHRPPELGATFLGVAARAGDPGRRAGHGTANHLDGAHRLAARGRSVAGRRTPGGFSAPTPHLIRRMLGQPGAPMGPAPRHQEIGKV
jgi:hypothetical protein